MVSGRALSWKALSWWRLIALLLPLSAAILYCGADSAIAAKDQLLVRQAEALYRERKLEKAEQILSRLQNRYPDSIEINLPLAKIYFFSRRLQQAELLLRRLAEKRERRPYLLMWLGRVLSVNPDRQAEALQIFEQILQNNPENYMAHYYLGRILEAQNRSREALLAYKSALAMEYHLGRIHARLGDLLAEMRMEERSRWHSKRAAEINASLPTLQPARGARGRQGRQGEDGQDG